MTLVIIGAGAIGGTLGAHVARAGHDVLLCDADEAHVEAINTSGLHIEGPVNEFTVRVPAVTPDGLPDRIDRALVAVKSLHTRDAAALLRSRLSPDGYVLSVQNGLTAEHLIDAVGEERVLSSFVNFGADVMAPGRIMQGNVATFRVGELRGGEITPRVREIADLLPYAVATDNVLGYLWGKEAYGAMLWAGAVSDLSIADTLEIPQYRPLMLAVAREALAQAPVPVESFDGFVPDDLEGSLDRLVLFNRNSAKSHSGIYRDLVVRKRKTEVDEVLRDIDGPIFRKIADIIHDIEQGRRVCEVANLDELAAYAAGLATEDAASEGHKQ
jgi:2-dehydropantoate 2-reductase